eukprot:TRINITY_DN8231_c2_g1_i1.p1 TRINITY_DN8231_c2_g1~~TRINITY_DN8231_c2_g1_i1.p1  ORF type:complete len:264 (+),score=30.13 TRINITY_DN8231_c2_g1_i1:458-1249(+)
MQRDDNCSAEWDSHRERDNVSLVAPGGQVLKIFISESGDGVRRDVQSLVERLWCVEEVSLYLRKAGVWRGEKLRKGDVLYIVPCEAVEQLQTSGPPTVGSLVSEASSVDITSPEGAEQGHRLLRWCSLLNFDAPVNALLPRAFVKDALAKVVASSQGRSLLTYSLLNYDTLTVPSLCEYFSVHGASAVRSFLTPVLSPLLECSLTVSSPPFQSVLLSLILSVAEETEALDAEHFSCLKSIFSAAIRCCPEGVLIQYEYFYLRC